MSSVAVKTYETVGEEWLASYAAGGLSRAKRLVLSCQMALQPRLSRAVEALETVGGVFLESSAGAELSEGFEARLGEALDKTSAPASGERSHDRDLHATKTVSRETLEDWMPSPLRDFMTQSGRSVQWRNAGLGVGRAPLAEEEGEYLYLLKAKPGLRLPEHSHRGEEWTLILQGGYHVGAQGYARGDLHREDDSCVHQPVIDDDGKTCICLVAVEGKLKFSDPLLRLVQPLVGI